MESNLSVFLTALIHHPVRLATSTLLIVGAIYVAGSVAGYDNRTSMISGLIVGSIFTYSNTVNNAHRLAHIQEASDNSFQV